MLLVRMQNCKVILENGLAVSVKLNIHILYDSATLLLVIYSEEIKNVFTQDL